MTTISDPPPFHLECVGDSFAKLKEVADKSFDVTITDPPFNAHVHANLCSGSLVGTKNVPKYNLSFDPVAGYEWANDLVRVTRRWVLIWCAVEDFGSIKTACGKSYIRGGLWYKPNAMGQLTADRPATSYEGIAILHAQDLKKRWNGRGSYGIWKCNGTRGKKGRHPNEKPIDLCLKLAALFSERNETVFDPFCGSSAVGEAAMRLGRSYVGWDNAREWIDRSMVRLGGELAPIADDHALTLCRMNT